MMGQTPFKNHVVTEHSHDIFINPTLKNAEAFLKALEEFGMGTASLTNPHDICSTEVTIFKDFVKLDALTKVKGLEFDEAWRNKTLYH